MLQGRALSCWYAPEDMALRDALETHLDELRRAGVLHAIDDDYRWADVVVLLVSAAFLACEASGGDEMARILAGHEGGWVRVIPVLVNDVDCSDAPFAHLPLLPVDARCWTAPVTAWNDRDQALASVARAIRAAFDSPG